ncbi:MAG TPA: DNA repair protein RecO [bacterium]|jgi:DNA repair protein RecO (recombination protein O)
MPVYKAEAIVIRRHNLGEADRVVTLLTKDHGKLGVVAKGARKPRSRFAGRLELFTHLRALLAVGRTLDVVSQVEVLEAFAPVREDLTRMGYASLVAEVTDRATAERQAAPELFALLRQTLNLIRDDDPERAGLWFLARVLVLTGYGPVMDRCVVCGRRDPDMAFSFALGGLLCGSDRPKDPQSLSLSAPAAHTLTFLLRAAPDLVTKLAMPPTVRGEVGNVLQRYVEYRFDVRLRSPAIIQRLRRPTANAGMI